MTEATSAEVTLLLEHKAVGNECYKNKDYPGAIAGYGEAVKTLPRFPDDDDSDDEGGPSAAEIAAQCEPELLKQGAIVLCNRAASYMALNKPIPANADAQRAAACDPTNWKAHWRTCLLYTSPSPRD